MENFPKEISRLKNTRAHQRGKRQTRDRAIESVENLYTRVCRFKFQKNRVLKKKEEGKDCVCVWGGGWYVVLLKNRLRLEDGDDGVRLAGDGAQNSSTILWRVDFRQVVRRDYECRFYILGAGIR